MAAAVMLGGVNHCSLHCRLTTFRGLMYNAKYSNVIGWGNRGFVWSQSKSPDCGVFPAQSQGCILRCTSNHRISPNDSVNYSD